MSRNPKSLALSVGQTDTASFSAWFGASKVVDDLGRPLVVYRGCASDEGADFSANVDYIYATSNPKYANNFAEGSDGANVVPVYMDLRNPLNLLEFGAGRIKVSRFNEAMQAAGVSCVDDEFIRSMRFPVWSFFRRGALKQELIDAGYDGLVWVESISEDFKGGAKSGVAYVAFRPEQIKSVIGNRGTFCPDNPDIRCSSAASYRGRVP
jgi:hypothetical protein